MRVLVTGASGHLGRAAARRLAREHEVAGSYLSVADPIPGCRLIRTDLSQPDAARTLLEDARPELIVHTAAIGRPDICQREKALADAVNARATESIAACAEESGARLLYISTDLVFDGRTPPYSEESPTHPLSYYAETKLEGEKRARAVCARTLVLRLSLMYGWKSAGVETFTDFIYQNFSAGNKVKLFSDQWRTPLYVEDAAEMIARLAVGDAGLTGTRHMAGPESLTRLRFGELFCEAFGFDRNLIDGVLQEELPGAAMRPRNCSLDGSRLFRELSFTPRCAAEALRDMREKFQLPPIPGGRPPRHSDNPPGDCRAEERVR